MNSQAHCLVAQANTNLNPTKEFDFPTQVLTKMNKARNANTLYK